jgi:uracil-DNA glycosylase
MKPPTSPSWRARLQQEFEEPYWRELRAFVDAERKRTTVHPPEADVFSALELTAYEAVRVMILGQDPYHGPGQAHGLAFSVRPGVRPPPSLRNVFRELRDDVGCPMPEGARWCPGRSRACCC